MSEENESGEEFDNRLEGIARNVENTIREKFEPKQENKENSYREKRNEFWTELSKRYNCLFYKSDIAEIEKLALQEGRRQGLEIALQYLVSEKGWIVAGQIVAKRIEKQLQEEK